MKRLFCKLEFSKKETFLDFARKPGSNHVNYGSQELRLVSIVYPVDADYYASCTYDRVHYEFWQSAEGLEDRVREDNPNHPHRKGKPRLGVEGL